MNAIHKFRKVFKPYLFLTLLLLSFIWACNPKTLDQRGALTDVLKSENLEGFYYSVEEDDTQLVNAFTNNTIKDAITLDDKTTSAVIKYTLVNDKKAKTNKLYKTEVINENKKIFLIITDVNSNDVLLKQVLPDPRKPNDSIIGMPGFGNLDDCIDKFECNRRPELQCEANRSCVVQYASIFCCITETQCFSIHFVITPNSFKCRLRELTQIALPDRGVFVRVRR